MSDDDDAGCVEHVWRLAGVVLAPGGAVSEYECERCSALLPVAPDATPPATV